MIIAWWWFIDWDGSVANIPGTRTTMLMMQIKMIWLWKKRWRRGCFWGVLHSLSVVLHQWCGHEVRCFLQCPSVSFFFVGWSQEKKGKTCKTSWHDLKHSSAVRSDARQLKIFSQQSEAVREGHGFKIVYVYICFPPRFHMTIALLFVVGILLWAWESISASPSIG